jgi:L-fuculose-phosphate aldolase
VPVPPVGRARRLDAAIVAAARALRERRLVVGSVGNVSARSGFHVRITPSRVPYDELTRADLVTVDLSGSVIKGKRLPSLERALHVAIYAARPDVGAVIHTHSPWATAWSFLGEPLPDLLEEQAYYGIGAVAVSPPCRAGSQRLADTAVRALGGSAATLIGSHGVVAVGGDCRAALAVAEVVEQTARVGWLLRRPDTNGDSPTAGTLRRACVRAWPRIRC